MSVPSFVILSSPPMRQIHSGSRTRSGSSPGGRSLMRPGSERNSGSSDARNFNFNNGNANSNNRSNSNNNRALPVRSRR